MDPAHVVHVPSRFPRPLKRKRGAPADKSIKKRRTYADAALDDLDWRVVFRPSTAGVHEEGGMLLLEEVEGVNVVYEDTEAGKRVQFRKVLEKGDHDNVQLSHRGSWASSQNASPKPLDLRSSCEVSEGGESVNENEELVETISQIHPPIEEAFEVKQLLPHWSDFSLHPAIYRQIHAQRFNSPTPIQSQALHHALQGRDVIGIAETGSGKTLAYGLPILNRILASPLPATTIKRSLKALILSPTRELALQVSSHLQACVPPRSEEEMTKHVPPRVSIVPIVGGMSAQKQERLLFRGVDIIVATPGRLWDLISEDDEIAGQVKRIQFFVLDEADRMIESGHFAELDNIIRLTTRIPDLDENGEPIDSKDYQPPLQTFVFSATMSKELQQNLKKRRFRKENSRNDEKKVSAIDDLLLRLDFRDEAPQIIDLSPENGIVSRLQESKIECLTVNKDVYLYYFLLRYPGRSLVFMSSIDGIRRLNPILELLNIKVWPLHSQLEQRQRLKNLDRFKQTPKSVLLATDVAARGLDILSVDHVIHYQIPRTADVYVHRNGRTARAMREGLGLLICAPDERKLLRSLLGSLKRKEDEIPEMPVERDLIDRLKARVELARQVDRMQHGVAKEKHDKKWLKDTAEAMEIELDDEMLSLSEEDEGIGKTKQGKKNKGGPGKLKALKADLAELLHQPILARGISAKFITSGSRPIVDDLLRGDTHDTLLGVKITDARADILNANRRSKGKRVVKRGAVLPVQKQEP